MSIRASFYLLPTSKYKKFCEMAHLVPTCIDYYNRDESSSMQLRILNEEDMNSPESQKDRRHYQKVGDYIRANSKQPFEYEWSGSVLSELLASLQVVKNIELRERTLDEENGGWMWYVFDKELKEKYLKQLNPSKFTEDGLLDMYLVYRKRDDEEVMKILAKKLTKKQLKELSGGPRIYDFPERGQALLDGIEILHRYLELVDDKSVVMLQIG